MLVVNQDGHAFDVAQTLLGLVETVPVPEDRALRERTLAVPLGFIGADDDLLDTLGRQLVCQLGDAERALGVLGARHRHHLVVQQLVGDVDAGGHAGLHGELPGVEEGSVADVLEQVGNVGERGLADPLAALPAHLGEPGDSAVLAARHRHHGVTADSATSQGSFGHGGRAVVRAAAAEVCGALCGKHFQRQRRWRRLLECQSILEHAAQRCQQATCRQFTACGDQQPSCGVLLADDPGCTGSAVEDFAHLGFDERRLVLDHEDLVESVGEGHDGVGPQRGGHADPQQPDPGMMQGEVVSTEVHSGLAAQSRMSFRWKRSR